MHDDEKAGSIVMAAQTGRLLTGAVTSSEVQQLCEVISVAEAGTVFLPWRWPSQSVEQLRAVGCTLRVSRNEGSLGPSQRESFAEAESAGVRMGMIGLAVDGPSWTSLSLLLVISRRLWLFRAFRLHMSPWQIPPGSPGCRACSARAVCPLFSAPLACG
jgi:hypothetical protein